MEKRKKIFIRIIAIVLALIMAGSVVVGVIGTMTAQAASKSELNALKDKQAALKQKKQDVSAKIDSKEYEQLAILAKKEVLDEKVTLTLEEIDNITAQIAEYEFLILEKEDELAAAEVAEDVQYELFKSYVRRMEENGTVSYYQILFDAVDFSDLLARIDFISEVIKAEERIYNDLVSAKEATAQAKAGLENAKVEQEATKEELIVRQGELMQEVEKAQALIIEIESDLAIYEAEYYEIDAAEADMQAKIDKMVEELKKQEAAGAVVKGTGTYIWPSDASRLVTSLYGTRKHPVYGVYKTHYGIDIGAGYGTNILAADGGTVITAAYSSSYGNYVIINHGGGNTTLYAHMSKMAVKVGQAVSQGQVIGYVGSTGVSTGPHIHYEIRSGGERVNPLSFYSNYTISPNAY